LSSAQIAFLIAKLKNTSGGPLLPGSIQISRDGVYIGQGNMPAIGIGEEIELSLGVPSRMITFPLVASPFSWQDRF
jgi:hypothetical protein